jgi:hypothetical protein
VTRWAILAALAAAACTTATAVMGPDGSPHFNVHCPRRMVDCYRKMAEVCPAGYELVNATSSVVGDSDPKGGAYVGTNHDMLIKCRRDAPANDGHRPIR